MQKVTSKIDIPGEECACIPRVNYDEKDYFIHHKNKYLKVQEIITSLNPKKILDIGVGTGAFYSVLPEKEKYEIHGLEIVPEFIPLLEKKGIHAKICDINVSRFPYEDNSFDLILCDSILEHTLAPKHLITEMARVLQPGGAVILITPNATSVRRRWDFLRCRNQFAPLIDNLYRLSYLQRCAVFYSLEELNFIMPKNVEVKRIDFIDEISHDPHTLPIRCLRMVSFLTPRFRDVVLVVAQKS